jgi:hypothetical protein
MGPGMFMGFESGSGICLAAAKGPPLSGPKPALLTGHSNGGADDVVDRVSKESSRLSSSPSLDMPSEVDGGGGMGPSAPSDRDTE